MRDLIIEVIDDLSDDELQDLLTKAIKNPKIFQKIISSKKSNTPTARKAVVKAYKKRLDEICDPVTDFSSSNWDFRSATERVKKEANQFFKNDLEYLKNAQYYYEAYLLLDHLIKIVVSVVKDEYYNEVECNHDSFYIEDYGEKALESIKEILKKAPPEDQKRILSHYFDHLKDSSHNSENLSNISYEVYFFEDLTDTDYGEQKLKVVSDELKKIESKQDSSFTVKELAPACLYLLEDLDYPDNKIKDFIEKYKFIDEVAEQVKFFK